MYSDIINKKFFKENQIKDYTAQQLVFAQIDSPELPEMADKLVRNFTNRAELERQEIVEEENPEKIIKYLRGKGDILNYRLLHEKILEKEDLYIPIIMNMIKTTGNDVFIENVVKLLAKSKNNYSKELLEMFSSIKYPYTLSLICVLLGFIGDEDVIPLMYDKYIEFKEYYPAENYNQGPLLALYELAFRYDYRK